MPAIFAQAPSEEPKAVSLETDEVGFGSFKKSLLQDTSPIVANNVVYNIFFFIVIRF